MHDEPRKVYGPDKNVKSDKNIYAGSQTLSKENGATQCDYMLVKVWMGTSSYTTDSSVLKGEKWPGNGILTNSKNDYT